MMEGVGATMEQLADLDISSEGVLEQTRKTMAHLAVCLVGRWRVIHVCRPFRGALMRKEHVVRAGKGKLM